MAQHYSDPEREDDPHALPDIDVYSAILCDCYCGECGEDFQAANLQNGAPWAICTACAHEVRAQDMISPIGRRWYWQACFPGCLPDGDPVGPFETEADAIADAQDSNA